MTQKQKRSWPRSAPTSLDALRAGGKPALARLLGAVESHAGYPQLVAVLDEAFCEAKAHVVALTGPPGVGKSTLTNAMIAQARAAGQRVGVIAVDPSSQVTGGALLGDRTRLSKDPDDDDVFVRSMAARDRLGGLSEHAIAAVVLMRAVMDLVIVESVGIGQSEADVALVADTCVLCIQPGSGDSLQFMKAGIMELPDIICVTKADMGDVARRARADVAGALSLSASDRGSWKVPVLAVSAVDHDGIGGLLDHCIAHYAVLKQGAALTERRAEQARRWVEDSVKTMFGTSGLAYFRWQEELMQQAGSQPFTAQVAAMDMLQAAWMQVIDA